MGQSGEMSAGSRSRERGERGEERERRSRSLGSDDMLTGNLIEGSEETGQGESTAADPVLSSVEREYRQEGMVERRTVEEERTEEEGEEERTRVAGGEDTFAESSSGLNRRWETSIMTAGDQSHSNRTAAKRTSHRVRATTVTSRRLTQSKPVGADYRNHGDTDEETNEAIVVTKGSPEMSPQPETNIEKMEQPENTTHVSSGDFQAPALQFITRKDLYSFLNGTGEVGEAFFANRALMELVQRIRSNITLFTKYQHSRQLVNALNQFADLNAELPEGWEKKLNREGKMFFIDHEHCLTTFMDPRLPLPNQPFTYTQPNPLPLSLNQSVQFAEEAPIRSHHTTVFSIEHIPSPSNTPTVSITAPQPPNQPVEMTYEMQVVSFFRKPNIFEIIAQRYERGVRPQLREIIEDVRLNGTEALERIQSSGSVAAYELALVLSLFEEEISSIRIMAVVELPAPREERYTGGPLTASTLQRKKDAFSTKLQNFKVMMSRLGFAQSSRLKFNLRRDHLLEDSYEHVMKSDVRYLQRKKLNICFKGEEGLDYGGPSREFFFLLSREIFNPYYGLFEYSANDTYTVQISPTSVFIQNSLDWFRFAGRVIGLVVVQGFLLDVFFTRTVYKVLMNRNPSLKDLESLEPAFYSSLLWIRDNDPEPLDLTFTVEEEAFGQLSTHELKEGGTDIPVTDDNKNEYIDLMLRWRLDRGITEQMEMLKKGFNEVMPISLLQTFDAQELEFLTAGTLEIDVADWKMHTEYRNGYHPNHPVILWFWQVVEMFDNEQRLRLLQFVTGTSSVPFEGFKALRGSNGPKRFAIDFFNDVNSLPRTHTCFNRIDLPPYPSLTILFHKLQIAIEEGNTFGIE